MKRVVQSLFIKIFIWFCLTLIAGVLASLVVASTILQQGISQNPRSAHMSRSGLALSGVTAVEILEHQGEPALMGYFKKIEHVAGVGLFLVKERGKEVTGRTLPKGAKRLINRAIIEDKMVSEGTEHLILRAVPFRDSLGSIYVILGQTDLPAHLSWNDIVIRILALLFTSGILCYVLARHLTTPLRTLQNAARQLTLGNLSVRVDPKLGKRNDEIGDLSGDFNRMAERLEDLIDSQKRLLRDISHELRSPLTRLNVALGLARQKSGPETTAALDRIEKESERLNGLIGQMLTLGRLEQSREVEDVALLSLDEIVEEIVSDANFEVHSKNSGVQLLCSSVLNIKGHAETIRSAIENAVRNALRYTPEGTQVEVSLLRDGSATGPTAVIQIRDHGPGVPETELSKIFLPFYRVSESRDRRSGGTGLGLAIAWHAAKLHGGSIVAKNADTGGLMLEIRLPLDRTA
jgi:two-component system, OmpR family, sensor histidine kinase CpxA